MEGFEFYSKRCTKLWIHLFIRYLFIGHLMCAKQAGHQGHHREPRSINPCLLEAYILAMGSFEQTNDMIQFHSYKGPLAAGVRDCCRESSQGVTAAQAEDSGVCTKVLAEVRSWVPDGLRRKHEQDFLNNLIQKFLALWLQWELGSASVLYLCSFN